MLMIAQNLGVVETLQKPFQTEELLSAADRALRKRK